MIIRQSIERPIGVTVFGSAILRTEPDRAVAEISVVRIAPTADKAFEATRQGVRSMRESLKTDGVSDDAVQVSRVVLDTVYEGFGNAAKFLGYRGNASFRLRFQHLDHLERVLSGGVAAGANQVKSVTYHTSRRQELRDEARRSAMAAARRKAEVLASAGGARVGHVVHIEDVDPEQLTAREGHASMGPRIDEIHVIAARCIPSPSGHRAGLPGGGRG